jgi:hypothetical protein
MGKMNYLYFHKNFTRKKRKKNKVAKKGRKKKDSIHGPYTNG